MSGNSPPPHLPPPSGIFLTMTLCTWVSENRDHWHWRCVFLVLRSGVASCALEPCTLYKELSALYLFWLFWRGYKKSEPTSYNHVNIVGLMWYVWPPLFLFEHLQRCWKPQPNFRPNKTVSCSGAILKRDNRFGNQCMCKCSPLSRVRACTLSALTFSARKLWSHFILTNIPQYTENHISIFVVV